MVQGRGINASLNDSGQKQAVSVSRRLSGVSFDKFYASSLIRTHETLAPFGVDFDAMDGFDEISWGDQEGVKTSEAERAAYAKTLSKWRQGNLTLNIGGGESPIQVMERQKFAMDRVLSQDHHSILICMHGRAMRILLCWMLNYPLNYMDGFPHRNCSFYSLKQTGNSFYLNEFNETGHLDG